MDNEQKHKSQNKVVCHIFMTHKLYHNMLWIKCTVLLCFMFLVAKLQKSDVAPDEGDEGLAEGVTDEMLTGEATW